MHYRLEVYARSKHLTINTAKSEVVAAAHRVHGSVRDTALRNRPFAFLWLTKAYAVLAGLYCSQVWSSGLLHEGDVFWSSLQTLHLKF